MKLIEIGTVVVVNVNGNIVRGIVAHVIPSSPFLQYTRDEPLYVVYGGIDHDNGLTLAVSGAYFEWVGGRLNPEFRGVAPWYKNKDESLSAERGMQ